MSILEWIALVSSALAAVALVACAVLGFALLEERRPWFEETRAIKLLDELLEQLECAARSKASLADLPALSTSCEFARKVALHTRAVDQQAINALQLVHHAVMDLSEARKNGASGRKANRALQEFRHSAAYCRQALAELQPARALRAGAQGKPLLPAAASAKRRRPDMSA
jgi:hypothetical protein